MERARLTYFDMRGRAEAIRILLCGTQTKFEDDRIVSADGWTALKPELPFGGLPIYRNSAGVLCESHAILRYLGRTLTPLSEDDLSLAELDAAHGAIADSQEDLWRFNWRENYYDHLESYARSTLYPRLGRLEAWFKEHSCDQGWFGPTFGHVDCIAFCYLDEIDAFFPAVLAEFSELAGFHARVASVPDISGYLDSDRRPIVFGMGCMGPKVDPRTKIPPGYAFRNPWTEPIDLAVIVRHQRRQTSGGR